MFGWWGRVLMRVRWIVLLASVAFVAVGAAWGTGIFGSLKGGGFDDPSSESSRAYARITEAFGPLGDDVVVLYSSPTATADEPGIADPVRAVLASLEGRPEVVEVMSVYTNQSRQFVSADGHATYVGLRLRPGEEDAKVADLTALEPLLVAGGDVRTEIGGGYAFLRDANKQIERDIVRAEVLSMPVLLVLLLFIFRGLVAALTPLVVGGVAILGGFVVTRAVASFTDVSVFAANVITLLGLGMAIDYALFVVSRFREELAAGHSTPAAIERMMRTAGRTVVISGLTVTLALSSLLLFPMDFLKSIGYGAMAAVLVDARGADHAAGTARRTGTKDQLPTNPALLQKQEDPRGGHVGPARPQRHAPPGALHRRGRGCPLWTGHPVPAGAVRWLRRARAPRRNGEPNRC
jgi:trehalose monomycolate/heme transporter